MRTDRDRLEDIMEAISLIEKYASHGRKEFDDSELIQVWMVKHIENIGEACRSLSDAFKETHPEVPWRDIVSQRSYLAHEYFAIDAEEVWNSVSRDIPELKEKIQSILNDPQKR